MNVHLHIDRLVLEGLPVTAAQGPLVQAAVEAELAWLLTDRGLAPGLLAGGALRRTTGTALGMSPDATPGELGTGVARSVHGGLAEGGGS